MYTMVLKIADIAVFVFELEPLQIRSHQNHPRGQTADQSLELRVEA